MRIVKDKPVAERGAPLAQWMASRRRRRIIVLTLLAVEIAALIVAQFIRHSDRYETAARVHGTVTAAEDGRTLTLRPEGAARPISVRLLGVAPGNAATEAAARKWLTEHAVKQHVTVSFDRRARRYDEASRLRGYVFLDNGEMVNAVLIVNGLGGAEAAEGYALRTWFAKLQTRAKPAAVAGGAGPANVKSSVKPTTGSGKFAAEDEE